MRRQVSFGKVSRALHGRHRSAAILVLAAAVVAALAMPLASSARKPPTAPYTVSVSPVSLDPGSTGNSITFRFTATKVAKGQVTVEIPAVTAGSPWTAPQKSDPTGAGYVVVSRETCRKASIGSIRGPAGGPWTIVVKAKCAPGKSFELTYGAGSGPGVTAATDATAYTFRTRAQAGRTLVDLAVQPVITVGPGPAQTLELTGLVDAIAGTEQAVTVTARDAFGNVATGYRGTVLFNGGVGASWDFPSLPTFTANDAGVRVFPVTAYTAGERTLTATDTVTSTITGSSEAVTITPAQAAQLSLSGSRNAATLLIGQTVRFSVTASALDLYFNPTDSDDPVTITFVNRNAAGDVISETEQTVLLENGTKTIDVDVAIVDTVVRLGYCATSPSLAGTCSLFHGVGVEPDLETYELSTSFTPNPDGTFDGDLFQPNLDMRLDPNSIVVNGPVISVTDGLFTIPIRALTVGGDAVVGSVQLTDSADPATGALVASPFIPPTNQVPITAAEQTGDLVTLTLGAPGNASLTVGSSINVLGVTDSGYNGSFLVTSKSGTNTITYQTTMTGLPPSSGGTVVFGGAAVPISVTGCRETGQGLAFVQFTVPEKGVDILLPPDPCSGSFIDVTVVNVTQTAFARPGDSTLTSSVAGFVRTEGMACLTDYNHPTVVSDDVYYRWDPASGLCVVRS
jgi:hypothetical protein